MTRRPNPTLSEIARGPRTAPGECEAWLVARAVEELRGELDGLRSTVLGHINKASPPARATVERLPRGLSFEAHETLVRSENRASDAIAELADARRELDEALRQLSTQAEEHERVVRERDAYKKLTHDALDAVGVETHPPDLHGHRMVDRIYVLARARDEAYEKLTQSVREHYPPAFRIVVAQRDALQQQLADLELEWHHVQEAQLPDLHRALAASRAALARIAEYQADPGRSFHQDYVNVKGIAKDALATATTEDLEAV